MNAMEAATLASTHWWSELAAFKVDLLQASGIFLHWEAASTQYCQSGPRYAFCILAAPIITQQPVQVAQLEESSDTHV